MPLKIDRLRIGTAGIPISTENPSTIEGIKRVRELGLDAMELEFVRSINISIDKAKEVGVVAKKYDVVLTAHAPYYINLNAKEKEKIKASIARIIKSAEVLNAANGYSVVFHPGYYLKQEPKSVMKKIKESIKEICNIVKDKNLDVWIRPETTGKPTQFGSLDELIELSEEFECILPTIDFAHLHARTNGAYNTYEEFREVLSKIEDRLGRVALDNMHIHFSGIEYSEKGERMHLILKESDLQYEEMVKAWKEFKIKGVAISESPNIEMDALLIQKLLRQGCK